MRPDSLRASLSLGGLLATFVMIPRVEIVELLALARFDVAIFDLEHGPIEPSNLVELTAAARAVDLYSVARLSTLAPADIGRVLDCGVDGVMVPHVQSARDAARAVGAARYPPEGERSLNPYTRGNRYGVVEPIADRANEDVAVIAMIEGHSFSTDLDRIVEVDGLDGMFVGPVDLSGTMGFTGQPDHPEVVAAVEGIMGRVRDAGVAGGLYVSLPEQATQWFSRGAHLVAVSADIAMLSSAFDRMATRVERAR